MAKGKPYVDIRGYHSGVTGSCIRNTVHFSNGEKFRFLVDFGMYQGEGHSGIEYNDSVNPKKINAILLTHTHLDHDGALPIFIRNGYTGKIYMSNASSCVLDIGLTDSYNIMVRDSKIKKQPVLYTMSDIVRTKEQVKSVMYGETIDELHNNIKITFFNNGHLIGASIILVQIEEFGECINLLFTGDYKATNTFIDIQPLPCWVYALPNLTIITESTYGTTDSTDVEFTWENDIVEACRNNRLVVNTAFGQGRFQELMYRIRKLEDSGEIQKDYPVKVDGVTGIDYTFRYKTNSNMLKIKEECQNFFPFNLQFVDKDSRSYVMGCDTRQIIIATSGMGTHGPASMYIPRYLNNSNALIYFTGYTSPCSLGRQVYEAEYGEKISFKSGQDVIKKAQVLQTSEFSSHARADELIDFINQFSPCSILINHGEESVKEAFEERIKRETGIRKTGILGMGLVFRINSYGIDKAVQK